MSYRDDTSSKWLIALKRTSVMLKNKIKEVAPQTRTTTKTNGHESNGKGRGVLITTVLLSTLSIALVAILGRDASCLFEVHFDYFMAPFRYSNLTDFAMHTPKCSKGTTLAKGREANLSSRFGIFTKSELDFFSTVVSVDMIS